MRYYAILLHHPKLDIEVIRIFNNQGNVTETAKKIIHLGLENKTIAQMHQESGLHKDKIINGIYFYLNPAEEEGLYKKIKQLPISEQFIFRFPYVTSELDTALLATTGGGMPLQFYTENGKMHHLFATIGIMQSLFQVMYPTTFTRINPVLGDSTLEDIRKNGLLHTRDNFVSFPDLPAPEKADNRVTGTEYSFTRHDDYHGWTTSAIPDEQQKKSIQISDMVQKYISNYPKAEKLVAGLIDMDYPLSRKEWRNPDLTANQVLTNEITTLLSKETFPGLSQIKREIAKSGILDESLIKKHSTFWLN